MDIEKIIIHMMTLQQLTATSKFKVLLLSSGLAAAAADL